MKTQQEINEKKTLVDLQLQNLCKLLNAEVTNSLCVDHTGKVTRKITLTYNDPE